MDDRPRSAYYGYMHQFIQQRLAAIRNIAASHKARSLDLFGSGTNGEFNEASSDFDFLVEFEPLAPGEYAQHYFELKEELEQLTGRHVDLVVGSAIRNPYFQNSVNATRQPLYPA